MGYILGVLSIVTLTFIAIAAWVTHVVACIGAITGTKILGGVLMLLLGVVIPPLGAIHGFMIWLGAGLF